ncbi:uncharacterized protein LOC108628083 [Ceratina calcarata]|uniref:Uncharacterized protein LOC108628083 n=1 Tax=Ceratina calcarata TaxID=156304 RepID=A0AAJ7S5Q5_9HYME|nr:uncharacterized protein LOC108628083 [Ceratina calcarata]
MAADAEKHLSSDAVFKLINKRFITLNDEQVKRNNVYLRQAIQTITERMVAKDQLFAKAYKEIKFCGSFYKGTKVGAPNEFDLNIILELPINYNYIRFYSPREGFIRIEINDTSNIYNSKKSNKLSDKEKTSINKFISDGLLNPDKFRSWIEGVMTKVVDELPIYGDKHHMTVNQESFFYAKVAIHKTYKSGPAFTIKLNIPGASEEMSVDLVPVLAFDINAVKLFITNFSWLEKCRKNPWFAVPIVSNDASSSLSWRLAFSLQEKDILTMYGHLKPVIRQMKKLRDTQNWACLKSYFIETVFLNKLQELDNTALKRTSFTYLFYKMLIELRDACKRRRIDYFWNPSFNLLEASGSLEMNNIANRIDNIIKDIRKNIMSQSFILAKYILTRNELKILADESHSSGDKYIEVKLRDLYEITSKNGMTADETEATSEQRWTCIIS